MLRYQENNELHRDFHTGTGAAIDFIIENYGEDAIKGILRKTGREVYKSIHEKLKKGDASELLEHLNWFYFREGAKYQLTVSEDQIVMEVFECPAVRHLRQLGLPIPPQFCWQTIEVNAGMCEDSPWRSEVEIVGEGHCIQKFTKEK